MRRYTIRAPRIVELTHQAFRLAVSRLSSRLVESLQVLKSCFSVLRKRLRFRQQHAATFSFQEEGVAKLCCRLR